MKLVEIVGVPAEKVAHHLPNTNQKHYCSANWFEGPTVRKY
jgi:hypothetical protein